MEICLVGAELFNAGWQKVWRTWWS